MQVTAAWRGIFVGFNRSFDWKRFQDKVQHFGDAASAGNYRAALPEALVGETTTQFFLELKFMNQCCLYLARSERTGHPLVVPFMRHQRS